MYNRSWRDLWRTGNLLIKNECLENTVLKKNVYLHTVKTQSRYCTEPQAIAKESTMTLTILNTEDRGFTFPLMKEIPPANSLYVP